MDSRLLDLLVCPVTKGPLEYDRERQELISRSAGLAYPIRDGIPVMLEAEARKLDRPAAERVAVFVAIIPARLASTRLPRKPLADLGGRPMVVRVAERARASGASRCVVATDSDEVVAPPARRSASKRC